MKKRYTVDNVRYKGMSSQELRESFLLDKLFQKGIIELTYCEVDRTIVGGAVPVGEPLKLATAKDLAASYFCEKRELGILNIGGSGKVIVDQEAYYLDNLDCLYVGKGSQEISFESLAGNELSRFYLLSYPAHTEYPTKLIKREEADFVEMGSMEDANQRVICKYIHPDRVQSCQLVMGVTELKPGSVWNTMPCHTHERRSEVYMYFNVAQETPVFHFMGTPDETRHIDVRDQQAVISPMWSIHSGAGLQAYTFCWGMGGENQDFSDMDMVDLKAIN